jgi:hypothetical protein
LFKDIDVGIVGPSSFININFIYSINIRYIHIIDLIVIYFLFWQIKCIFNTHNTFYISGRFGPGCSVKDSIWKKKNVDNRTSFSEHKTFWTIISTLQLFYTNLSDNVITVVHQHSKMLIYKIITFKTENCWLFRLIAQWLNYNSFALISIKSKIPINLPVYWYTV